MDYRQMTLTGEPTSKASPSYQGGSRANLIALQDCVKRLLMSVIYGRKCGVSLAKLSQDGLWLKMYGDYFQARMDGSFEEYSETLPSWGLMLDGVLIRQHGLEPYIDESGFLLLPTPMAGDTRGVNDYEKTITKMKNKERAFLGQLPNYLMILIGEKGRVNPGFYEQIMGFQIGWTDLNA